MRALSFAILLIAAYWLLIEMTSPKPSFIRALILSALAGAGLGGAVG